MVKIDWVPVSLPEELYHRISAYAGLAGLPLWRYLETLLPPMKTKEDYKRLVSGSKPVPLDIKAFFEYKTKGLEGIEVDERLDGLGRYERQRWVYAHRDEIFRYNFAHTPAITMKRFNITIRILNRIMRGEKVLYPNYHPKKLT